MIELTAPLVLVVLAPLLYLWWRLGRGPREVWGIRAAIVLLAVLMVASPSFRSGRRSRHIILLVDRSLSCGKEAMATAAEWAGLLHRKMRPEDRLSATTFGKDASAISHRSSLGELTGGNFDDASDLSAGLALAGALLEGHEGGRIFLVSDGLYTGPDPLAQVPRLHKAAVAVDYWPILQEETSDVALTDVHLPERVQQGHPFEISFTVSAPEATPATFRVQREGMSFSQQVSLEAGSHRFSLGDAAGSVGLVRYAISVAVEGDARPENNRALAVTNSVGPPQVLVLNRDAEPDNVTRALEAAGMAVRIGGPATTVSSADLKPCAAVVLENIALSSLNDRADAALRNYVRETGGGVIITGGRRSFAEGGYYQSRMEDILPVSMMRKEHYVRPKIAMCIVLDRSGSMAVAVRGGLSKMDLANRAAAEAVGVLMPQDEVAVIAVDSTAHVVVPLTAVEADRSGITNRILRIESMGGGIFVYTGLRAAVGELLKTKASTRHIVLFADADDSEEPGDYKNLVNGWVAAGGSISVIGLGTRRDQDARFLMDIASRGGGEVFFTADPQALPRVFCQDVIRLARKTFLEQLTGAAVSPEIVRLGRLGMESFPDFLGYNLCYAKEDASQLITTTDDNTAPVLAVWERGLGRVAALTCEADGEFTGELRTWPDYKPFFSSLVKWLQRERDDISLFATISRTGRTGTVVLEMDADAARDCTGATALIIPPSEGPAEKLPLRWVSPQRMEAGFKLESDGVYHGVALTREGRRVSLPPVVLPYSPEFEPKPASAGQEVLEGLAAATGGKRIMHVRELLQAPTALAREPVSAAPLLAGLLVLLILCDIVTRKRLWGHLMPRFARTGYGRAKAGLVSMAAGARHSLRRRRARARAPAAGPAPEEAPAAEAPEAEGVPEDKESVFERAKRRARAGRDRAGRDRAGRDRKET